MSVDVRLQLQFGIRPAPAPRAVMEAVSEVQVSLATSGPSGFDLKFAVGTRSPLVTELLPQGFFAPATRVVISVVVGGATTVLMDGVVTRHEMVPADQAGRSVLSVKGEDLTRMMDLVDLTGLPYPGLPLIARIAIAIGKYAPAYGIVPLIVPSVLDIPNPVKEIPVHAGTDRAYVTSQAELVGYVFYLQPGPEPGRSVAYWGPPLRTAIPFLPTPPPLAIDWDGRSNVESLQFAFDGFAKTQWVVAVKTGKLVLPIPVPSTNPLSPLLGAQEPTPFKVSPVTGLSSVTTPQAIGIALGKAARTADVVSGSGTLDVLRYGAVLPARTLVEVRGAGVTYDGSYHVDATTHTLKKGSYQQSFTLNRNALVAGSSGPLPGVVGAVGRTLAAFAPAAADFALAATGPAGLVAGTAAAARPADLPASPTASLGGPS